MGTTNTIKLREYIARGCDFSRMSATEVAAPKVLNLMALMGTTKKNRSNNDE